MIKLDVLNEIDRAQALGFEVDVLFNIAGMMEAGSQAEIPLSVFRSFLKANVFAALELAQGFAWAMVKRGKGRIVWTSSVAGLVKVPLDGAYAASKHAAEAICSALDEELVPHEVKMVTVNPAAFRTGFNDTGMESMDRWWGGSSHQRQLAGNGPSSAPHAKKRTSLHLRPAEILLGACTLAGQPDYARSWRTAEFLKLRLRAVQLADPRPS